MLEELLAIANRGDFYHNGSLNITHIEGSEYALTFFVDVSVTDATDIHPRWQIICSGVREHSVSLGYSDEMWLSNNHVLLWTHTAPTTSLYFHGTCENAAAVTGALYERHWELARKWIPFHTFLNSLMEPTKLIAGGGGMLADGPEPFILAYEEVMQRFGFSTSHLEPKPPRHWNGEAWVEETAALSVLILEDFFIVAENFEAKKV
jgi:hypothetical protein